jgi:hypothetical protein
MAGWICSQLQLSVQEGAKHTDLCVHQLSQSANELGRCIEVVGEEGIVDELTDRVPERRLEALQQSSSRQQEQVQQRAHEAY